MSARPHTPITDRLLACHDVHSHSDLSDMGPLAIFPALLKHAQRMEVDRASLLAVLLEYIGAADDSVRPRDNNDVRAMRRFAVADSTARALLARIEKEK